MAKVKIPFKLLNPLGADKDEQLFGLAVFARTAGADSSTTGEYTTFDLDGSLLPMQVAMLVVSKGGDVSEYPTRLAVEDVDAESIFETEDEEGEVKKLTWKEWAKHDIVEGTDKKFYVAMTDGVINLPLSQLLPVLTDLVDVAGYKAILPVVEDDV